MLAALLGVSLSLAGCDERPRTAAEHPPGGPADRAAALAHPVPEAAAAFAPAGNSRTPRRNTPLFHGKPLWAENRRGGAEENARYQFEHRGADIGAKSLEDYLTRVHAFFDHPPADAETATRSSNGDRLIYSPGANLFGVQRQDGAPRLLMRPVTGRAYWEDQRRPQGRPNMGELAAR
jgi:pyocin large subunit-like protein